VKKFIEEKIKKIEEQNDIEKSSQNAYTQIDQFIDTILVEAASDSNKSYEVCAKGLLSLKSFVNKNLLSLNNLIVQKQSFKGLIEAYEREEKIKSELSSGKDPLKREIGERPESLKKVRNLKDQIVSNEDFDVEEE